MVRCAKFHARNFTNLLQEKTEIARTVYKLLRILSMSDRKIGDTNLGNLNSGDTHPILFFDGVCGLCNHFVDFTIQRDSAGIFRFATLQGETAKQELPSEYVNDLSTVVLKDGMEIYTRSEAALRVLSSLPGVWKLSKLLLVLPRFLRDWVYDLVASSRYKIFGKSDSCRIPSPEERSKFLD